VLNFLTKNETNTIQQPSNSLDMAPCDFFLFDRSKKPLLFRRFKSGDFNVNDKDSLGTTKFLYRIVTGDEKWIYLNIPNEKNHGLMQINQQHLLRGAIFTVHRYCCAFDEIKKVLCTIATVSRSGLHRGPKRNGNQNH
ncbi:hypothetical protein ALC60_08427, partial [Trachymyrmex zeteki]